MKKKKIFIVVSCIALFTISIFLMMDKSTFSVMEYEYAFENTKEVNLRKSDLQKLVVRTALAFYNNDEYIQYKSGYISSIAENNYSYRELTVSPEELNVNNTVYMDDASYIFSVYMNALKMDLTEGLVNTVDLKTGDGIDVNSILEIIEKNDERLILQSDEYSSDDQEIFLTKYMNSLELGDIIVYTEEDITRLALYVGLDEDGEANCIYLYDTDGNSAIHSHDVSSYLFPNGKFISDDTYYAIVRPIANLNFDSIDRITLDIPVNSLARVDDVYVRRYTDVGTSNVYRGENINYTIEVLNNSDETVVIKNIYDMLDSYLVFVSSSDGKYDIASKSIMWNNVSIEAGASRKFTYTVKVTGENEIDSAVGDSTVYGKEIISNNARISFDGDNYLELNSINFKIANKYIDEQIEDLSELLDEVSEIDNSLLYGTDEDDYKTLVSEITGSKTIRLDNLSFYSFLYYNAFEIDFGISGIMDDETIKNSLFVLGEDNFYTRANVNQEDNVSVMINNMVVGDLYGGSILNDLEKTRIFSPIIAGDYSYSNLVSGDIIIYWDEEGVANSYLFVEYLDGEEAIPLLVNYNDMGILKFDNVSERLDKRVINSALYVVLRPSMIFDVKLDSIEVEPINIKVGNEKQISFVKKPINASVNSIGYSESPKFEINEQTNVIKGLATGSDVLTMTFNDDLKVDVNVIVSKEIYDFKVITDYEIDEVDDNKIIYVGTDIDVETILNNISFNNEGYDKKIYNLDHDEITDKITEKAILEVSLNGELLEQYKIISFSINPVNKEELVSDENVIKFVNIDTKVADLKQMLTFNGNEVTVQFSTINGEILSDDDKLSTGDYLIFNVTSRLQFKYQISVIGDVSGNGIFNGNDVVLTRRHIVGWVNPQTSEIYELEGVFVYAMDFSMNGKVNGNDVSSMRRKLVN